MPRPNVIFIFADQLRYDALSVNGNRVVRTPNLERLAREGVVFDEAYSSCPICSPYRGQILTGRYSHANGVVCNEYALFEGETTIAHVLADEGYGTAFVGKWHLGHPPYTESKRYGFSDLFAYNCDHDYFKIKYWHNEEGPFAMGNFAPIVETDLALDWIGNHLRDEPGRPFCVFLAWGPPHWGRGRAGVRLDYTQYPQEYNLYNPKNIDLAGNVPMQFLDFAATETADYLGMVTALDACVGRILEALDAWGLADDTIVCFSSDHGDHLSSHGYGKPNDFWMHPSLRASKGTPYEESVHIPLIMRFPRRLGRNYRTNTMTSSVDVMPTLLGLCDVAVPQTVQGTPVSPVAGDTRGDVPDSVYLQVLGTGWPTRDEWTGLWRGLRTHDFTYARWNHPCRKRLLFDRKKDPLEMHNVADDPEYAHVARQMEERLKQWIEKTADPFDTGKRLPDTGMLDLGQVLSSKHQ